MQRWRGLGDAPPGWGRCVATIGTFDGVHRGHRQIIARAVERAALLAVPAVVVTFEPHPSEIVRPGTHPALLTTRAQQAELLAGLGVDALAVLAFTAEFSRLSPEDFAHTVLVDGLHASAVVVGRNFRFGARAAGDVEALVRLGARFGFTVDGVELLAEPDGVTVSSTYVRSCVAAGDVAAAAAALTRPHRVEGVVVRGDARGRTLGYPTANVAPTPHAAIPADGVYAAHLARAPLYPGPPVRLPAAVSIGTNPTFAGTERRVEAYVLPEAAGEGLDLYGEHVGVDFLRRLRTTEAFADVDALLEQMASDVEATRAATAGDS